MPAPKWLVQDLLPQNALVMLGGATGTWKSFWSLDVAGCVASGRPFFGRPVQQGAVVYVAAEGASGIKQRWDAWKASHGLEREAVPLYVVPVPVAIHDPLAVAALQVAIDLKVCAAGETPRLIVVDTAHRCRAPGRKENDENDVADFLTQVDVLRREYKATVQVVHHLGAAGERLRGSTAWESDTDTVLFLTAEDDERVLSCEKQKDAAPCANERYRLVAIPGTTSAVLQRSEAVPPRAGLTDQQRLALEVLASIATDSGVAANTWLIASAMKPRSFWRAKKRLEEMGAIGKVGRAFIVSPAGRDLLPTAAASHAP